MTRPAGVATPEGVPMFFTKQLGDNDALRGHAYYIPFYFAASSATRPTHQGQMNYLPQDVPLKPNLSPNALAYMTSLGLDANAASIWYHALAIGCSPAYLLDNADGIRSDWPRIPLPSTKDALLKSAALGAQIANLLDGERPVEGVTAGAVRHEFKTIAEVEREGGLPLNPSAGDFDLTAGWGHGGKDGVTMPAQGPR